jgi:hypothetical protein
MTREELAELNPSALMADGFGDALIGAVQRCGLGPVALYSQAKCIKILMERDKMDYAEAMEFFEFNTLGAYMGEYTPMYLMDDNE